MASLVIVVSAVLVLSCGQTDRHTDADEPFIPATLDDMSKYVTMSTLKHQQRVTHSVSYMIKIQDATISVV